MELIRILERLDLSSRLQDARQLLDRLPADAPDAWRSLGAVLALHLEQGVSEAETLVFGISGGQGAGKSTLAGLLARALGYRGLMVANLSLDDFYLTKAERSVLGRTVHPLLATRGVPGTHDVELTTSVIEGLKNGIEQRCPRFDKAADDRRSDDQSQFIDTPIDVVILEGWCVGAGAQPAATLSQSMNELERLEDPTGEWRQFVNSQLEGGYRTLWGVLDELLFLKVPNIEAVRRWRGEQERQHPQISRMSRAELDRFIAHYERITRWMGERLSQSATMVGLLDDDHDLADLIYHRPRH